MPEVTHILETCIYGSDLRALERFYARTMGFRKVSDAFPRGLVFRVSPDNLLLAFDPELTRQPHATVPSHGAAGAGHVAFAIDLSHLEPWRARLTEQGVAIEREVTWETGARSLYFRDPAGNSVELMAGKLWPA